MAKRFYAPYHTWEDYQNGMFKTEVKINQIELSKDILCNNPEESMMNIITFWPIASKHNLSNLNSNRRSWLGQAACCFVVKSNEFETRLAWRELTKEQQSFANECADKVITIWEQENNFNKNDYIKEDFTL